MSNARTVEERATAAAAQIYDGVSAPVWAANVVKREFADLVETDNRVVALVEAARKIPAPIVKYKSGSIRYCDLCQMEADWKDHFIPLKHADDCLWVALQTALKPFTEK